MRGDFAGTVPDRFPDALTNADFDCEGGWGINTYYALNPLHYVARHGFMESVNSLTREDAIIHPLFTPFREEEKAMLSTNLFTIADANKSYELRARFLGDAIPAESFAMGANEINEDRSGISSISLMGECMANEGVWPDERVVKGKDGQPDTLKWHHSDWKQLAYCFVYKLFDKINKYDGGNE